MLFVRRINDRTSARHSLRHLLSLLGIVAITAIGCGPSQEDLMMRAAQRPRSDADKEEESDTASNPPQVAASATPPVSATNSAAQPNVTPANAPATPPNAAASSTVTNASNSNVTGSATPTASGTSNAAAPAEAGGATSSVASSIPKPISERQPAAPLDEFARRKRSAENMTLIGQALGKYVENNKRVPLQGIKAQSGIMTLSWRVELLPYLGYEELYRQFNVNQPWDSPQNIALLDRIPDCFVSPERFDNKTNYLAVAGSSYLFQEKPVVARKVEDGLENTLAIVEVNEDHAIPWTSPFDYAPEPATAGKGLGQLRPEGTYAIWGNGWPTFVKKGVGDNVFHRAFTYESGDSLVAGDIHNALRPEPLEGETREVVPPANSLALDSAVDPRGELPDTRQSQPLPSDVIVSRQPEPTRAAIAAATEGVRKLYEERLKKAAKPADRREIADEMLEAAAKMLEDTAGAYALRATAISVYASIGDLEPMCRAIDEQVAAFEVDAIALNADALRDFGKRNGGAMASSVNGQEYLRRALPVIYRSVERDEYDYVIDIAEYAVFYESQSSQREFIADLNRLKQQLTAARNHFKRMGDALATLRSNEADPRANSEVGRYVAFIKGDWEDGLPLLVKGDNERIAQIAKVDLATDSTESRVLATADAWWDLGESTTSSLFKGSCRQRAAHWYRQAVEVMPDSLNKLHAKSRLEEAGESQGGSPLEAIRMLAEDIGLKLDAAMRMLDQPRTNRRGQRDNSEDKSG